ncbi:MAG TPA: hypothetical protein VFH27_10100, partial [Longimicrobiaceae bacterium]|nr:hypothetical protein [Longimicrobiaceae bacterium]
MSDGRTALAGIAQLAAEATVGTADVVESMHHAIGSGPFHARGPQVRRKRGIGGFVYRSVRRVARLSGRVGQAVAMRWAPRADGAARSRRVEALTAALNGVAGNHLAGTDNPLAPEMC